MMAVYDGDEARCMREGDDDDAWWWWWGKKLGGWERERGRREGDWGVWLGGLPERGGQEGFYSLNN